MEGNCRWSLGFIYFRFPQVVALKAEADTRKLLNSDKRFKALRPFFPPPQKKEKILTQRDKPNVNQNQMMPSDPALQDTQPSKTDGKVTNT